MEQEYLADGEEMYGPGSDLMISLFAVAILLLGIVGIGQGLAGGGSDQLPPIPDPYPKSKDLISRQAYEEQGRLLAAAREEATRLEQERARQAEELSGLRSNLEEAKMQMRAAESKLRELRDQKASHYLDLGRIKVSLKALAAFITNGKRLTIQLSAGALHRMADKVKPYPPGANEILIETFIPPEILAFTPAGFAANETISEIYLLSTKLGQAYREALSDAGVPLACIRLDPGSFETAPDIRKKIMIENGDATQAFDDLAIYYRGLSEAEAGEKSASVDIRLGPASNGVCDAARLAPILQNL